MEKNRYYAAYGSNLNTQQMRSRCPSAGIVGTSEIKGYRLMFKGNAYSAYLTIEEKTDRVVPVAVWSISDEDERNLDLYEGFPVFYYKKEFSLPVKHIDTGEIVTQSVFSYVMCESASPGMPSDLYLRICKEGYRSFGFDESVLERAIDDTKKAPPAIRF